jgi:hypothetical protein
MKKRQEFVKEKWAELGPDVQAKYEDVAWILNRPTGLLMDDNFRKKVETKALKNIVLNMKILEECCGILNVFFGAQVEFSDSTHPCRASSYRTLPLIQEELNKGMTERLIGQKLLQEPQKRKTPKQWYSEFINKILLDARGKFIFVGYLYVYLLCIYYINYEAIGITTWRKMNWDSFQFGIGESCPFMVTGLPEGIALSRPSNMPNELIQIIKASFFFLYF